MIKIREEVIAKFKKDRHIYDEYELDEDENYLVDQIVIEKALSKAENLPISVVSNSVCPKCGCNKITGDGSKAWCLNEKCNFVTTDC